MTAITAASTSGSSASITNSASGWFSRTIRRKSKPLTPGRARSASTQIDAVLANQAEAGLGRAGPQDAVVAPEDLEATRSRLDSSRCDDHDRFARYGGIFANRPGPV
ncbi:MAG: hypothetical protein R2708_27630 [Vicinamibacterales bacterium]